MKRELRKICYCALKETPGAIAVSYINILTLVCYFYYKQRQISKYCNDTGIVCATKFMDFQSLKTFDNFVEMYWNVWNCDNIDIDKYGGLILKSYMSPNSFNLFERKFKYWYNKPVDQIKTNITFLFEVCLLNGYKIAEFEEESFILSSVLEFRNMKKDLYDVYSFGQKYILINPGFYSADWAAFGNIIYEPGIKSRFNTIKENYYIDDSSYKILFEKTMIRDFCHRNKIIDFRRWTIEMTNRN